MTLNPTWLELLWLGTPTSTKRSFEQLPEFGHVPPCLKLYGLCNLVQAYASSLLACVGWCKFVASTKPMPTGLWCIYTPLYACLWYACQRTRRAPTHECQAMYARHITNVHHAFLSKLYMQYIVYINGQICIVMLESKQNVTGGAQTRVCTI